MRGWSIVTHAETPSSCPTRSLKPARVNSLTCPPRSSEPLHVAVSLAQFLLVDLADACLGNAVDEQDLFRDPVFRDDPLVGEGLEVALDGCVVHAIRIGGSLDHERERPLTPSVVLDADHGDLGNA